MEYDGSRFATVTAPNRRVRADRMPFPSIRDDDSTACRVPQETKNRPDESRRVNRTAGRKGWQSMSEA
jgi:hypothetical protein